MGSAWLTRAMTTPICIYLMVGGCCSLQRLACRQSPSALDPMPSPCRVAQFEATDTTGVFHVEKAKTYSMMRFTSGTNINSVNGCPQFRYSGRGDDHDGPAGAYASSARTPIFVYELDVTNSERVAQPTVKRQYATNVRERLVSQREHIVWLGTGIELRGFQNPSIIEFRNSAKIGIKAFV
jgi:hypothetical protein